MKKLPNRIAIFAMLFLLAGIPKAPAANAKEPQEAPAFSACIEYSPQGYVAKGTFTEIAPDTELLQPMYSLDGETYQDRGEPWNLHWIGTAEADVLAKLQNQTCLYSNQEPLKSYLDKKLDHFYLKLRVVLKNGTTYETQAALIDRGSPQPVPERISPVAAFAPSLSAYDRSPFCRYGKYQLTVSEGAAPEDIASRLPDTLPVEIQLTKDSQPFTSGIVDCPVTWKSLSLPVLAAGESVTVADAAEEIVIPKGTLLNTPTGIFRLDEPLKLYDQFGYTDEVRLVINVIAKDEAPSGALSAENHGLEMVFHLKPTGATAIRAYTLSEGKTEWVEIPDHSLLDAVNAQPSKANSGYALVLDNAREPYQSYCAAANARETCDPFYIGIKIEGGVYDGRQLVLAWPQTYKLPTNLPNMGGSGGNEANAGAGNQHDSTPEGQRPNLRQTPEDNTDTKEPPASGPQNPKSKPPASSRTGKPPKAAQAVKTISPPQTGSSTKSNPANSEQSGAGNQPPAAAQSSSNAFATQKTAAKTAESGTKNAARTVTAADANNDTSTVTAADANNDTSTVTAADANNDAPIETAVPSSFGQDENTDAKETSGLQKMPDRQAADKSQGTFPPPAAAAIAGIGVIFAAAARKVKYPAASSGTSNLKRPKGRSI